MTKSGNAYRRPGRRILCVSALIALSGCATPPSRIAAVPVYGAPFAAYDCAALAVERAKIMDNLTMAKSQQQDRLAVQVASGVALGITGALVASVAGPEDKAAAIGAYRGSVAAIDGEAARKECTDPVFGQPEPLPPAAPAPNQSSR